MFWFCVCVRKVNTVSKLDVYPKPRLGVLLDWLSTAYFYLSLDLGKGYWQISSALHAVKTTSHFDCYVYTDL